MMDAAIAVRIRPARAGVARRAIIVLRLPAWPRPCAQYVHRRQQLAKMLDRERTSPRNAALMDFSLMNGY